MAAVKAEGPVAELVVMKVYCLGMQQVAVMDAKTVVY